MTSARSVPRTPRTLSVRIRSALGVRRTPFKRATPLRIAMSEYELFRHVASKAPHFRWIVGHGQAQNTDTRVPPGTWVVFLSRPGHLLNFYPFTHKIFREQILQRTEVTRKLALDQIPPGKLPSLLLLPSSWKLQIHGPNDMMPNVHLELFDNSPLTANIPKYIKSRLFGRMCGVTKTSRIFSSPTNRGEITTVKNLVLQHGRGIYFVVACRGTPGQNSSNLENRMAQNTTSVRGGPQLGTPATNTTGRTSQLRRMNALRTRRQGTFKTYTSRRRSVTR
jgi:hypothetical protein